ncbi:phage minor head protein [Chryseobacterium sp. 6424]|uniref:phage head morphogenesis protein n=1 Tax=Chryseobacterium sp. 6424 TaxID=2039166 RepID=UPI0013CF2831|nr:phage minor head protein [Chryseobacterium sp. 6424]
MYYDKLSAGVDVGFSPKSEFWDEPLAKSLKTSIAEFSAFKETSFRKTLEDLLTKDGKLTPKSEFLKEAYKVSGDYNTRWLETEYHQTVANAQSAEKWQDFQRNKNLYPNLRYSTVGDGRVRPEHAAWDGIVKPINDPWWKDNLPPNDWGCRCTVVQTDEPETDQPTGGTQLKIEFANNPGVSGKIFNGSGYMTSGGLNPEQIEKVAAWGRFMFYKLIRKGKEAAELAKHAAPYKIVYKSESGAAVKVSPFADKYDLDKNITTATILADNAITVKIRPHILIEGYKNPEYQIRKLMADRKEQKGKGVSSNLKSAKAQGCKIIVFEIMPEYPSDLNRLKNSIRGNILQNYRKDTFSEFIFIREGKLIEKISAEDLLK